MEPVVDNGASPQGSSGGNWKWYAVGAVLGLAVIMFLRRGSSSGSTASGVAPNTTDNAALQGIMDSLTQLNANTQAGAAPQTPVVTGIPSGHVVGGSPGKQYDLTALQQLASQYSGVTVGPNGGINNIHQTPGGPAWGATQEQQAWIAMNPGNTNYPWAH